MITISLAEHTPYEVGAQVAGQFSWTPEGNRQPNGIKVLLRWRTEGRGSTDQRTVAETVLPVGPVAQGMPVQHQFALTLPAEGPVSYNGTLLRILWELRVEIDMPWAINEKADAPIIVIPRWIARA